VLQRLVTQIQLKGYPFYSIHDYIPFTPSVSLKVGSTKSKLVQIGNVTGKNQDDIVTWDKKTSNLSVIQAQYDGLRNENQPAPRAWASLPYTDGSAFTLNDMNDRNKKGLWVVRPSGKLESYSSNGSSFAQQQIWTIPAKRWYDLYELRQSNGDCILAGQSQDRSQLLGVYLHEGKVKEIKPYTFKSNSSRDLIVRNLRNEDSQRLYLFKENTSQGVEFELDKANMQWKLNKVSLNIPDELGGIRFGDFNGDGKEDILRSDSKNLTNRVYLQTTENAYKLLSVFGPWGRTNGRITVADFDGNGKVDIAMLPNDEGQLDVALSYQSLDVNE
ncbi:FG-GAP repeat domain-containing protein, partial [Paenibacillus sp. TAF58]